MSNYQIYILIVCIISLITANDEHNSKQLTTLLGAPVGSKTTLMTAGPYGPTLLQDVQFLEEISHFDRERIPERVVHAKGSAAFGVFRVTNPDMKHMTKMSVFSDLGKETEVAVRFSSVTGEQGSADTVAGDPRGFAVKFYTDEGNWDLVSNNVPMFFIRDSQQFSSAIHAQKRNPKTGLRDPTAVWDFFSLRPENLNIITYMFSDFGIPDGFRFMPGFSINAFKFVNDHGQHVFVKFHWIPNQGIKNLDTHTAQKLAGIDPDYSRRDLYNAIASHNYPSWTLNIQMVTDDDIKQFDFNPFDATKIWPLDKYPLTEVGVMTLNRNPRNFFVQTEQLAFDPANLVPGIEPSPDKLLQGRLFSYSDTQRHRLGPNFHLIPVNKPVNIALSPTQRDGAMRTDDNLDGYPNYYPNSFGTVRDNPKHLESNFTLHSKLVARFDDMADDNYRQPRDLYNSFPQDWRERLHKNVAMSMALAQPFIQTRALKELTKVSRSFGEGVRHQLLNFKHNEL